jgi:hypothetical protein
LRVALGVAVVAVGGLALAQVVLPPLAGKRVRERVGRYGEVREVTVSAFPAVELLWGRADSVTVTTGPLAATPAQVASSLWEARGVGSMTVISSSATLRVAGLPYGVTLSGVDMRKRGETIETTATLTQKELDGALPGGFRVQPLSSVGEGVRARVSGGFFGVRASITALISPREGRLVAEPEGLPFGGLAAVTLFSDPHLKVVSIGVQPQRPQPLTYALSLRAILR